MTAIANISVSQGWVWTCGACGQVDGAYRTQEYAEEAAERHANDCEGRS